MDAAAAEVWFTARSRNAGPGWRGTASSKLGSHDNPKRGPHTQGQGRRHIDSVLDVCNQHAVNRTGKNHHGDAETKTYLESVQTNTMRCGVAIEHV